MRVRRLVMRGWIVVLGAAVALGAGVVPARADAPEDGPPAFSPRVRPAVPSAPTPGASSDTKSASPDPALETAPSDRLFHPFVPGQEIAPDIEVKSRSKR